MSHVVSLAAAEAAENPEATDALREFAKIRVQDAEVKAHKILAKHGLTVPIEIQRVDLEDSKRYRGYPCIKFSTWAQYLLDTGRLSRQLCACQDLASMRVRLTDFWARYASICPTNQIFDMQRDDGLDLSLVIPVFSHTDEGRSAKKQAIWLLSTHGALGRGTRGYLRKNKQNIPCHRSGFGLNFCGYTWSSNFMFACMLRKFYKHKPEVLDELVRVYARDMEDLLRHGVSSLDGSVTVRFCHIGTKGDLPALARMGNMKYTFGNCPRAAQSRKAAEGVCWMCRAGQEANGALGLVAVPYEDTSGKPLWEGTLGDRLGWDTFPPISTGIPLLPEHGWEFFKTDVWHNYHLGLGKHWVASSLVSLLENLPLPFDSMDQKLTWLAKEYREFCKRKRVTPHVEELGRETLSWPQASSCPVGAWHKGSATTLFMYFLEELCRTWRDECQHDELLRTIATKVGIMCISFVGMCYTL